MQQLFIFKKSLLSQYDLINIRDKHKNTILHIACGFSRLKSIELLLNINPCLINEKDEKGHTAIDVAIKHGQYEVISWFINNNVIKTFNSLDTSNHRRSYLHFCCKYGDNRILRLICSKMSELQLTLDQLDSYGNTAAHLAAKYNHLDCLQVS
jgi:ankyrin repeat protein